MKLEDLSREELQQLKVQYLDNLLMEEENINISYWEIANIDDIIDDNDKDFINTYNMYSFCEEDFF